jgi:hypothetical protein
MSTRSGITATSREQVDAAYASIDSIRNGDNKLNNNSVPAVEEENEFFYLEGWKLWAIMCTLYLNTLLGALDVVSMNFLQSNPQT